METRTALDDTRYTYGEFWEHYGAENAPAFWWNAYHDSERWHGTTMKERGEDEELRRSFNTFTTFNNLQQVIFLSEQRAQALEKENEELRRLVCRLSVQEPPLSGDWPSHHTPTPPPPSLSLPPPSPPTPSGHLLAYQTIPQSDTRVARTPCSWHNKGNDAPRLPPVNGHIEQDLERWWTSANATLAYHAQMQGTSNVGADLVSYGASATATSGYSVSTASERSCHYCLSGLR